MAVTLPSNSGTANANQTLPVQGQPKAVVFQKVEPGIVTRWIPQNTAPNYMVSSFQPNNSQPVPPFGVALSNALSHRVGYTPNGPAYNAKYGYVPPYLRTDPLHYAKMTDGRTYKNTWSSEVPFRQVVKRGYPPQYISSPGKNYNKPKISAQNAITFQILSQRGLI